MRSVGEALSSQASGLGDAILHVVDKVIAADDRSKRLALERYKMLLKEPPIEMEFESYYQQPKDGKPKETEWCCIAFSVLMPAVYLDIGTTPIITKFTFDSSFEAIITRRLEVTSETEVGFSASWGGWGMPSVGLDITQKIGVTFGEDSTQSNTLDIHQTWDQSPVPYGIRVIQEALAQVLQKLFTAIVEKSLANPKVLTDDEVKVLQEKVKSEEKESAGTAEKPERKNQGGK